MVDDRFDEPAQPYAESDAADLDEGTVTFANPLKMEGDGKSVAGVRFAVYDKIDGDGFPLQNAVLDDDDIMIGCVEMRRSASDKRDKDHHAAAALAYKDQSKKAGKACGGCVVDRVFVHRSARDNARFCKVRLRETRVPELGDKLASRFGQKGVIGMLMPARDMPFCHSTGVVPDIILNPNAFPKRMTVTHMLECLLAKTGAVSGARYNANTFEDDDVVGEAAATLGALGLQPYGDEVLYNGRTGEQIAADVFVGVNYYGRLKHMVADKYQYRTRGPVNAIVRQPTKGADDGNGGGLRLGEMEQNALLAHGISSFVKESFMDRGDRHRMTVDVDDGTVGGSDNSINAPPEDAPHCYGTIEVPYAFKLLQQELMAMSVDVRMSEIDCEDPPDVPQNNTEEDDDVDGQDDGIASAGDEDGDSDAD